MYIWVIKGPPGEIVNVTVSNALNQTPLIAVKLFKMSNTILSRGNKTKVIPHGPNCIGCAARAFQTIGNLSQSKNSMAGRFDWLKIFYKPGPP